ncbi:MAG: amino acid adenylation domain-containing protein [Acidobacteria bacterium]|nr:amino acid adenylation domain-containing protein [Acidobacteriota bacterium]
MGIYDNFFELGGDSILSIQMISRLKQLGFNITLTAIFQHQTIESLRAYLQEHGQAFESPLPVSPFSLIGESDHQKMGEDIEDAYPLTMLQTGMLFHSEFLPDSPTYHDILTFHIRAPFDEQVLGMVLHRLTKGHPVLRTSFDLSSFSRPLQIVHAGVSVPLDFEDLRGVSPADQEQIITSWIEEEKGIKFDWTKPPLLRMQVHQRSDETFQFSLALHHSILDGWSIAAMLTELFQSYLAALDGNEIPARPLRAAFRDYVAQELRIIESPDAQRYWDERLSELNAQALSRRFLSREEVVADVQIETSTISIAPETSQGLRKLARVAGVPLKTVLLAGHLRAIGFYLNESDVITGLVTNSRPETNDGEKVLGLFLNTVPFRLRAQGGTWIDLAKDVLKAEIELLPYRSYPLGLLQRSNGNRPIFDTVFNYVHFHVYGSLQRVPGVDVLGGDFFEQTNFPLAATFSSDLSSNDIELTLAYDTQRFETEYIRDLMDTYRAVLGSMAQDPAARYEQQSLLSSSTTRRILEEWNDTDASGVKPRCFDELFVAQVARTPSATAAVCENKRLTYDELNRRSNQMAHYLRGLGVGPEGYRGSMIRVDRDSDAIESHPEDDPPQVNEVENTAYVIYTSGSMGKPKGVMVSHRGLANVAEAQARLIAPLVPERVLQFSSLSFDASIFELLLSLLKGATLYLGPRGALLQGAALSSFIKEHAITTIVVPPSVLAVVPEEDLPALRTILVAGEPCPVELVKRWAAGRQFFNLYGPTETTIWATAAQCTETTEQVSIGRPILNTRTYILNTYSQLAPVGVPGELCIAGVGLATGYLNRPDLTAEKFMPDPFSREPGGRIYRSGDLARYLPDGNIEFLGRIDHQVKVRGYRIELGEIETVLAQHPQVREAVVLARGESTAEKRLIGYMVSRAEEQPAVSEMREYLRERLPDYMIPGGFVWVERMPVTANGKLDRAALPEPEHTRPVIDKLFVAPQTELEAVIAANWCDALRLDKVGIQDNFFDLGGHSLDLLQVQTRLQTQLNRQIPIAVLFQFPTVSSLARHLSQTEDELLPQLQNNKRGERRRASVQARREFRQQTRRS